MRRVVNRAGSSLWGCVVLMGLSVTLLTGCPVDTDELATAVTEAALNSVTNSIVDSLATYLAGG
jgi:hypothetical protein